MEKVTRPPGGKRILVLEDDQHVRDLLYHVLLSAGYVVDSVGTVGAAAALLERHHYHLVLADDELPDGRGVDIADKARARGIDAVVVTGYALRMAKEDLSRHDLLIKPVSPAELVGAVERHIGAAAAPDNDPAT